MEGSPQDKRYAEAVLPVLSAHHDLLVSLLLMNAAANEALPIFLDRLVSPMTAGAPRGAPDSAACRSR